MTTIVTRAGKGSPLSWAEGDANFTNLNGAVITAQATADSALADITNHLADTVDAHDASAISFSPAGGITSTTVQAAIEEVAAAGGTGTVTSIGITTTGATTAIAVSGSPVTTSGTISLAVSTFSSTAAGVTPASGGGTTNYLRADGSWAAPPGAASSVAGSNTQIQFNDSGVFGADADLTWDKTNNRLGVTGNIGIGVTPANATTAARSLEIGSVGTGIMADQGSLSTLTLVQNLSKDSTNSWVHAATGPASAINLKNSTTSPAMLTVYSCASATANASPTFVLCFDVENDGTVNSYGAGAGYVMQQRDNTSNTWAWYATGNLGYIWNSVSGNSFSVDTSANGKIYGSEMRVGNGQSGEKRVRLTDNVGDVYFALNGTAFNLYDVVAGINRWTTDSSGNFTAAGNVTAYSDIRFKSNVKTIENPLELVSRMRGVTFDRDGRAGVGVIAQEMEQVLPEVVLTGDDGIKSVAYGNIVGVLIEAVKELKAEVDSLKAQLNDARR